MKKILFTAAAAFSLALTAQVPDIPLLKVFHSASTRNPAENVLLSPWGIQECFGMVSGGAGKNSAEELSKILGLDKNVSEKICRARKSLTQSKTDFKSYNAVFFDRRLNVKNEFIRHAAKLYNGNLYSVNFNDKAECAKVLNSIVNRGTSGVFKKVFNENSFSPAPDMLLLNVLYFNGSWDTAFDRGSTSKGAFYLQSPSKRKIFVKMMNDTRTVPYYNDGTVHGIMLDYTDRRFNMSVLTTVDKDKPLSAVTELLANKGISYILRNSSRFNETVIKLPKLKLSGETNLKSLLSSMGMTKVFDSRQPDLTGTIKEGATYVSSAKQLVKLELDEVKTEVAAVTYAHTVGSAPDPTPPKYNYFYANHPFVLVLFDSETRAILLTAAVVNPAAY